MAGTRAYLDAEATNGIRRVHWEQGDVISVYSDTDTELKEFKLTSLAEDNKATFTGDKVTGNKFYAVFAPGCEYGVDEENPDIVHFNNYELYHRDDLSFTGPMVAASSGNSFVFKQTTGLIHVSIGNIHNLSEIVFEANGSLGGYVDLSENQPSLIPGVFYSALNIGGVWLQLDNAKIDVFFVVAPTILENGFNLIIHGMDANDNEIEVKKSYNSKLEVKAGKIYSFSLLDVEAELEAQANEIIEFADENVKAICVQNWDTNGDGELSYAEAAAVTDVGEIFRNNPYITSFDEFRNFTYVTSIDDYAFQDCSRLTSFTCLATNPPSLGSNVFNGMNGTIFVPAASVEAYKAADGWKDHASQIQAIP